MEDLVEGFFPRTLGKLSEKHSGQTFVFIIGGLLLGLLTLAIFADAVLGGANVIQNDSAFPDSAKLLGALVAVILFLGVLMVLVTSSGSISIT